VGFGIRLKFGPIARAKTNGALDVLGAVLDLSELAKPSTLAKRDSPQVATLTFHGVYLDHARNVSEPELEKFATLTGSVVRRGSPPRAAFLLDPASDFEYLEPEPEDGEPFRELRFGYGAAFDAVPEDGAKLTRLRLPREPEGARFFELGAELHVAGAEEAGIALNDRLDLPLGPLPGPMFEWREELSEQLPPGLSLLLENDGRRMLLQWEQGEVFGEYRRFVFHRVRGIGPCTLTAKTGARELVLLKDQLIDDPKAPIRWEHFLEELVEPSAEDVDDPVVFLEAMPEIVGTV
jgi:hypothetical protein